MSGGDSIRSDFWVTDENGNDFHLDLLGFADLDRKVYAVSAPLDGEDASPDPSEIKRSPPRVTIFNLTYLNEQPRFSPVTDKALCEKIFGIYSDRIIEDRLKIL